MNWRKDFADKSAETAARFERQIAVLKAHGAHKTHEGRVLIANLERYVESKTGK